MEFNEWTEAAIEEGVLQKINILRNNCSTCRVSSWTYDQNLWKIAVEKFHFCKVACL